MTESDFQTYTNRLKNKHPRPHHILYGIRGVGYGEVVQHGYTRIVGSPESVKMILVINFHSEGAGHVQMAAGPI